MPLAALVRVASHTLADWAVIILIDEDGAVQHIASAHRDAEKGALAQELHERQLKHASGAALLWQAIQSGEPMLYPVVTDEMLVRSARNPEHLALLRENVKKFGTVFNTVATDTRLSGTLRRTD